jgi:hypothetical protein
MIILEVTRIGSVPASFVWPPQAAQAAPCIPGQPMRRMHARCATMPQAVQDANPAAELQYQYLCWGTAPCPLHAQTVVGTPMSWPPWRHSCLQATMSSLLRVMRAAGAPSTAPEHGRTSNQGSMMKHLSCLQLLFKLLLLLTRVLHNCCGMGSRALL